jgi:desulfoferrodoxin (superoxide reductase-like protein)
VRANVAKVKVTLPGEVEVNENFTIELEISHSNNNEDHYVDWVRLYLDDEMVKEWTYTPDDFVPDTLWTLDYSTMIGAKTEVRAKANCNLHGGSQNMEVVRIIGQDDGGNPLLYPFLLVVVVILVIGLGLAFMRKR